MYPVKLIGGPLDGQKMLAHDVPQLELVFKTDLEKYNVAIYKLLEKGIYKFDSIKQS